MKLQLNPFELELLSNAELLQTKNQLIQRVVQSFSETAAQYQTRVNNYYTAAASFKSPKISRGENYLGLPWVMLDYPRQFGNPDIFAIRTMFWWGNFFSISVLLTGKHFQQSLAAITKAVSTIEFADWYIAVDDNLWNHQIDAPAYLPANTLTNTQIAGLPFFKMAKKIPLTQWDELDDLLLNSVEQLLLLTTPKLLSGEKDL